MHEELAAQIAFIKADTRLAEKEAALVHDAAQAEIDRTKPNSSEQKLKNQPAPSNASNEPVRTHPNTSEQGNETSQPAMPVRSNPVRSNKVGRNEPCPCGSGMKFERCCSGKPQPTATGQ